MTDEKEEGSEVLESPAAEEVEQPEEKLIPVSRVEELVKKAKLKGRDAMAEELEKMRAENEELKTQAGSMGGIHQPIDFDEIRQRIMADLKSEFQSESEERAQRQLEEQAQQLAQEYHQRMAAGKESFEDFDEIMADFNPASFPNLVYLATQVDNTPAVMYELMKNPSKWATAALLSEKDPSAAQNMINRLSSSIKSNEQAAAQEKSVPEPLGRLRSSPTGQDTGELSMRDLKQKYRV